MKAVSPKKKLGQHFLNDLNIAQKIADLLQNQNCENILEIGPGMGVLTQFLIPKIKNLKLVDPQKLTAILSDFHDQKYSNERVKEDFDLDDAFLAGLSRFKVANTYKKIQDTTSKDEIGHQGTKIDDNVQQRADTSPRSDKDLNSLKLRISVDD